MFFQILKRSRGNDCVLSSIMTDNVAFRSAMFSVKGIHACKESLIACSGNLLGKKIIITCEIVCTFAVILEVVKRRKCFATGIAVSESVLPVQGGYLLFTV